MCKNKAAPLQWYLAPEQRRSGEAFELCLLLICINKKPLEAIFIILCFLFANPSLVRKKAEVFWRLKFIHICSSDLQVVRSMCSEYSLSRGCVDSSTDHLIDWTNSYLLALVECLPLFPLLPKITCKENNFSDSWSISQNFLHCNWTTMQTFTCCQIPYVNW